LFVSATFIAGMIVASIASLESVPPLWWDEGWTMSVARNWVELGYAGRLLAGEPAPPGLNASFTVTVPISLSFRFFGVGIYQARFVVVVFMLATLCLLYCLTRRVYNPSIAEATLAIAVLMPVDHAMNPIFSGRQVLAEMPLLFFLIGGYVCFLSVPGRPVIMLLLTSMFWSFALVTKLQVLPFWLVSMLLPLVVLWLYERRSKSIAFFALAVIFSLAGSRLLASLWQVLLPEAISRRSIAGLYEVTAFVTSIPTRLFAMIVLVLFGVPTLLGLCYALWRFVRDKDNLKTHLDAVRFSLLILAGSWFFWYVVLSVAWIRYLLPAVFIGSMFVAAMFYDLTGGFKFSLVSRNLGFNYQTMGLVLVITLIGVTVPRTLTMVYQLFFVGADASVQEVATFINTQTPPESLVETYDSELFFLLNRSYHYPPDQLNVGLVQRTFLYNDDVAIDYDPLTANPDYLIVGPHSRQWSLYDQVLRTDSFRLIRTYKRYDVYERVR
jgi:hypothetical protein